MNTLRDTDEGRARPSVWPVYLAAAVVLVISLAALTMLVLQWLDSPVQPRDIPLALLSVSPAAGFGLFGLLTVVGLVLVRPWGWWCGVAWTAMFFSNGLTWYVVVGLGFTLDCREALVYLIVFALLGLPSLGLLIWPLVTRRRLFFPPKPEGEE